MATNNNADNRQRWLAHALASLPAGSRILDAGAGEQQYRKYCSHLNYVSQDFCQYDGSGDGRGLQTGAWNTQQIDIVSDISSIPEPDKSFDAILCSEVLEHIPEPTLAIDEFSRLLRNDGILILTAPFASLVHFAPYHYCSGFSRYWYEHHLPARGFEVKELTPNGDWFALLRQEISRLRRMERNTRNWSWPFAYGLSGIAELYFKLRGRQTDSHLACFGWHCVAVKKSP